MAIVESRIFLKLFHEVNTFLLTVLALLFHIIQASNSLEDIQYSLVVTIEKPFANAISNNDKHI